MGQTSSPYDVAEAFQGLATTVDDIDTDQLAQAFTVLADTFRDTPDEVRASLDGLSRLSNTIASRDAQLEQLLDRSRGVTNVLAQRDEDLVDFLANSNLVLEEVRKRREVIDSLLTSTITLSEQLIGPGPGEPRAAQAHAGPPARHRQRPCAPQQDNLDAAIPRLATFVRVFANNLGNGRWFDTYIYNLNESPTFQPATGSRAVTSTRTARRAATDDRPRPADRLAAAGAALATLAAVGGRAGCGVLGGDGGKTLTANFDRTVGLYENSDVRILGVRDRPGHQDRAGGRHRPGRDGRTTRSTRCPPTRRRWWSRRPIVSDRYVQLTPVYVEVVRCSPDGAVLARERTAVPVELDKIFSALDKLNVALGPDGANKDGALSDLLDVSAKNLDGNGEALGSHAARPLDGRADAQRPARRPVRHHHEPRGLHHDAGQQRRGGPRLQRRPRRRRRPARGGEGRTSRRRSSSCRWRSARSPTFVQARTRTA